MEFRSYSGRKNETPFFLCGLHQTNDFDNLRNKNERRKQLIIMKWIIQVWDTSASLLVFFFSVYNVALWIYDVQVVS